MNHSNKFYRALGVDPDERGDDRRFAQEADVPILRLRYYNDENVFPSGGDLEKICAASHISPRYLKLKIGHIDREIKASIIEHAGEIEKVIDDSKSDSTTSATCPEVFYETEKGTLYEGDCLDLLASMDAESVDLIFADPPFNLDKEYPSGIDDDRKDEEYLRWCERWLSECVRVMKHGGSLFLWNLPQWNTHISSYLNKRMCFRHWIATDIKYSLPIRGRLYPSHYSLLYYCKGERPNTFDPDRLPLETCRHCYGEVKDYGGYKSKMNPDGVNLTDVWYDIPPVRHSKYKHRSRGNELSLRLMDRIIEMATEPDDTVFDPFGGAGTTYVVSELKDRNWIGVEIGPADAIKARLRDMHEEEQYLTEIREGLNVLFPSEVKKARTARGLWTDDTYHAQGGGDSEAASRIAGEQGELDLSGE